MLFYCAQDSCIRFVGIMNVLLSLFGVYIWFKEMCLCVKLISTGFLTGLIVYHRGGWIMKVLCRSFD